MTARIVRRVIRSLDAAGVIGSFLTFLAGNWRQAAADDSASLP